MANSTLKFTKTHGIGNDFILVDCLVPSHPTEERLQSLTKTLCDRHFGVGADGLLLVLPSRQADFKMRMFNPDGSEAEMCGNGIRCFANFLRDRGYTKKTSITAETGAGILTLELVSGSGGSMVRVDMGQPVLERSKIPMLGPPGTVINEAIDIGGETVRITAVSMGNPHIAIFEKEVTEHRINRIGPILEVHAAFPRRINVHLVKVISSSEVDILTWERGAGRTLACGTGACGVVVACVLNKLTERKVLAHLPGGDLTIEWSEKDNKVYMTGPAVEVFSGSVPI